MEKIKNGDELRVMVMNRLDANTSEEFLNSIEKESYKNLILDLKDTDYISSAALRAFMVLKNKAGTTVKLENIKPSVQSILDISGFSKIF